MRELIPSKDVRDYMKKMGKELTDFEKATLAYNYHDATYLERLAMIDEIRETTNDKELAKQIQERIDREKEALRVFYERKEGMIYRLTYLIEDIDEWDEEGIYYMSGELAHATGIALNTDFEIEKYEIVQTVGEPLPEHNGFLSCTRYDKYGTLDYLVSYEVEEIDTRYDDEKEIQRFEFGYVDVMYPFRYGDFVRGVKSGEIGLAMTARTDEEYFKERERWASDGLNSDYTASTIRVEYPYDDGEFGHSHEDIVNVEFAEPDKDDIYYDILHCMRDIMLGNGSIQALDVYRHEIRAKKK